MPAEDLPGIVQRSVASRRDTRTILPDKGESFLSGRGEYMIDVQNMAEFRLPPAMQFELAILVNLCAHTLLTLGRISGTCCAGRLSGTQS